LEIRVQFPEQQESSRAPQEKGFKKKEKEKKEQMLHATMGVGLQSRET
jgi:hypothetical protein